MVISEGVGVAFRDLFPGAPSKVGLFVGLFVFVVLFCFVFFFQLTAVLLAKLSDILLLTGVSKQEFLFSLLIR